MCGAVNHTTDVPVAASASTAAAIASRVASSSSRSPSRSAGDVLVRRRVRASHGPTSTIATSGFASSADFVHFAGMSRQSALSSIHAPRFSICPNASTPQPSFSAPFTVRLPPSFCSHGPSPFHSDSAVESPYIAKR